MYLQEAKTCEYKDNNYSDIHYDFGPILNFSILESLHPNYQLPNYVTMGHVKYCTARHCTVYCTVQLYIVL